PVSSCTASLPSPLPVRTAAKRSSQPGIGRSGMEAKLWSLSSNRRLLELDGDALYGGAVGGEDGLQHLPSVDSCGRRDVSGTDPFDELGQVRDGGRGEFGLGRADEDAGAASSLDADLAPPREACAQGWSPEALDPIERETSHTSEREADR